MTAPSSNDDPLGNIDAKHWVRYAAKVGSKDERLLRITPEHWIKYVTPAFIYISLMICSLLLFILSESMKTHVDVLPQWAFFGALVVFLFAHHWFFFLLMGETENHIVVTSKRVIHIRERLFFEDEVFQVSFDKMKTVEAKKEGILQNILQYGSLWFEGTKAVIRRVPHPGSVAREIEQAMGLQ